MFNSVGSPEQSFIRRARSYLAALCALFLFAALVGGTVYASGTITGTVFQDFNQNGLFNTTASTGVARDLHLAGVTVTAYDSAGTAQGTTTTVRCTAAATPAAFCTGADTGPNYSLSATGTGPYRVEFTWDNTSGALLDFQPSTHSTDSVGSGTTTDAGSTIRILPDGSSTNVNLALNRGCDYCQNNPKILSLRFENGIGIGGTNATNASIISMPYNPSTFTQDAQIQETGAVWGISYNGLTQRAFASAFLKRHVGLGPRGLDGVYVLDYADGTGSVIGGFDLEGITASNGGTISLGSVTRTGGSDYTLPTNAGLANIDLDAFAKVGTVGFGNIDFANDGKSLWMVNLNDRTLVVVDTSLVTISGTNPNNAPTAAVKHYNIVAGGPSSTTITGAPSCTNGTLRPFGLKIRETRGFLGVVCDAATSATRQNPPELIGYVLSFDISNPTSFTQELSIPFTYNREPYYQMIAGTNQVAGAWQRWMNTWTDADINTPVTAGCCTSFRSAPSPILSDIAFMPDGSLILGVMDRFAAQSGWSNNRAVSGDSATLRQYGSVGDILLAKYNGPASYTLEAGENDPANADPGYRTDDSPGNAGEFFYGDLFRGFDANHFETMLGGIGLMSGSPEVVTSVFDPNQFNAQGVASLSTNTGARLTSFTVTSGTGIQSFGKASGMGDVELLCNVAPIELGNRVWNDTNNNGLQDPDETPIAGITLQLWVDTDGDTIVDTQVGSVVTDANGEYYFGGVSNANMFTNPAAKTFSVRVNQSTDDAEQTVSSGTVVTNGTTYDIPRVAAGSQLDGLRFQNVNIPAGATITNATIQFTASANSTTTTVNATIRGEAADSPATYAASSNNISSRSTTTASVNWSAIGSWTSGATTNATTPNLSSVVQEIVDRAGWINGNSMAFVISDNGSTAGIAGRQARSFDTATTGPASAALLSVSYQAPYSVLPGTAYQIRLDPAAGSNTALLTGKTLTTQNAAQPANGNASASNNNAILDVADSDAGVSGSFYVINLTTGNAGSNNHSLDIGFFPSAVQDYGDLPDTGAGTGAGNYQTLASNGGPSHTIVAGLNIGAPDVVDAEDGTLQNATATADDNSNTGYADDEDGIAGFPTFTPGSPAAIDVTVNNVSGNTATLYGFIDWNGDGDFGDADEVASVSVPDATVGTVTLNFNVPASASIGTNLGARFRLTTDTLQLDNDGAIGAASDGEVEDYIVIIASTLDYGDLPDTGAGTGAGNYQTLASDGGSSHTIVAGLNIGAPDVVDAENGTLQNATATADDNSNTGFADDEDGIASFPTFTPGGTAAIDVTVNNVSGNSATLYGFIDWNGDGDFGDADEAASVTVPDATVGTVTLNFNVPAGAATGTNLGARFRLTTDTLQLDNDGAIGAASDGEVEDYIIRVQGAGAIGNYVWVDENSDGEQDKGEVGIPNVTVQLKDSAGNVIATQVTDSNGGYLFTDLSAGTYYVEVLNSTIPTGMTQTTTYPNGGADFYNQNQSVGDGYQINLGAGETNLTADFGYNWNPTNDVDTGGAPNAVAALGDRIWIDTNGNGAQDANEIGVSGAEVTIYGSPGPDNIWGNGDDVPYTKGGYIPTRTTDANGWYMFDDLPPGQYLVRVTDSATASHDVLGAQYNQTGDADHWGTTGTVNDNQTTIPVILGPGDVFLNADFGYQPNPQNAPSLGSIGNFVWYDRDADGNGPNVGLPGGNEGNGAQNDNTEFGLGGVTVALIQDSNANGRWDSGEPIIATTHTSNGTEDVDGDGTTDPVGFYRFRSLPITDGVGTDDYLVWVNDTNHVLSGLVATYDKDGSSPVSGLATGLGISAVTNLGTTGGSPYGTNNATDQDFGYTDRGVPGATNPGMIGDRVWLDLNNDGVQDANEPGIPGVEMELYDSDGTTLLATTTTGANGLYLFPNLNVDDGGGSHQYYVRVDWTTLPGGITQTYDYDGLGTLDESTRTLTPADPVQLDQDFGYVGSGSIGNFVWLDTNANGIVDGSDASQGIEGVTIDLYDDVNRNGVVDAGDIKLSTTTTGANGGYLFTGLPTEDIDESDAYYVVNVTDTAGVLTGFWHSLGADQSQGTNNTSKASPYSVILETGTTATENVLTVDFGYYVVPGAVGNYVWLDTDKDGVQDAGENGINGVTVTLEITYPNGTVTTITTLTQTEPGGTRDGWYSFGNLLQDEDYNGLGTYGREPTFNITVTLPPGYTASPMGNGTPTTDSNDPTGTGAQPFKGQINTLFSNDGAPISSYDFGMYLSPTAVDVKKVRVKVTADNNVLLRWRSVSEAQIAGFNIQRSDAADGTFANVNTEFIPAKAPGNASGKGYKFLDSSTAAGSTYWYRIEIMHTDASVIATEPRRISIGDGACNAALTAPELLAPLNDAQVKAGKVRLQWQAVTCAAYYRVQVKPDARDAKLVLNRKHLKNALTVKDLVKGASYQWRVQACSANNECVASDWQKFETKK